MGLEDIVSGITQRLKKRFITTEERYQNVYDQAKQLTTTYLDRQGLRSLDDLAVELKWHHNRHEDDNLEATIKHLDEQRSTYRTQGPAVAYSILTAKGSTYTNRFKELQEYLATQETTYDDLRLVKRYLNTNNYLKRKERHLHAVGREDDAYFTEKQRLKQALNLNLLAHEVRASSQLVDTRPTTTWVQRGMQAATAACIALAAIPTPLYLALL